MTNAKRLENRILLVLFLVLPFIVAGAFWISPWLGWPVVPTLGLVCLGVFAKLAEKA